MCHLYPTKMSNFYGSFIYINLAYNAYVRCLRACSVTKQLAYDVTNEYKQDI